MTPAERRHVERAAGMRHAAAVMPATPRRSLPTGIGYAATAVGATIGAAVAQSAHPGLVPMLLGIVGASWGRFYWVAVAAPAFRSDNSEA